MMAWIALGKQAESAMADELVAFEPDALKASLAELRARAAATDPDTPRDIAQILALYKWCNDLLVDTGIPFVG